MSSIKSTIGGGILMIMLWVLSASGWLYYMWFCFKLQIFGWLIAGILLPPVSILIGLWSIMFGVPPFMLPEGM